MAIRKAEKRQAKLRLAIIGPTGSGKTYSALGIAKGLGEKVGLIDTERKSADLYADHFDFDVDADMTDFGPQAYIDKINEFARLGYDVLVIDSLSHAWNGKGGALEMVDEAGKRSRTGNNFAAWRDITPLHNRMVDTILNYPGHVIVTVRSKMDYVQERSESTGKMTIRKVGLQPVQRDGLEYEFTIVGDMDIDHNFLVTKSRCKEFADQVINKPGVEVGKKLSAWINSGAAVVADAPPDDVEAFRIVLREALESRGFTKDQMKQAAGAILTKYQSTAIADLTPEQRVEALDAVGAGKLDKYLGEPAAV